MTTDNANIQQIMSKILELNIGEISQLLKLLSDNLGINMNDVMSSSSSKNTEEEEQTNKKYKVSIVDFDRGNKIALIKKIRDELSISLLDAKSMLDNIPIVIKQEVSKEEADNIILNFKDLEIKIERTEV